MIHILNHKFERIALPIASFLIKTPNHNILFETGPHSSIKELTAELARHSLEIKDIDQVFLTHIHLDHAGAAWVFAEQGAKIYVHPKGYKHLADPSRLMESARRIYQDMMDMLWGEMHPIPENQLHILNDHEEFTFDDITIKTHFTPGHAVHHAAFQIGDELIAGDVAGVKEEGAPSVIPCPPPDIHIEDWLASIERLRTLNLKAVYVTHFGKVSPVEQHLDEIEFLLKDWSEWIRPYVEKEVPPKELIKPMQAYILEQLKERGISEDKLTTYEFRNPTSANVFGLYRYWKRKLEFEKKK